MSNYNLNQIVQEPTILTQSLIDHIYVSSETNISHCCVVKSGLSDHFAPFVVIDTEAMYSNGNSAVMHTKILYRNFKKLHFVDFFNNLESITWPEITDTEVNYIISLFVCNFLKVVDKHIPLIEKRVKREKQPDWITDQIRKTIKIREILENRSNKLIRAAKQKYYIQRGTGMIASSSTFCPHLGRVIRDLFRLLDAVYGIVRKH